MISFFSPVRLMDAVATKAHVAGTYVVVRIRLGRMESGNQVVYRRWYSLGADVISTELTVAAYMFNGIAPPVLFSFLM